MLILMRFIQIQVCCALIGVFVSGSFAIAPPDTTSVFVNEFSAAGSNGIVILDEDEEMEDWIELFNPTDSAVSLDGWRLTDDTGSPDNWVFPDVSIPAHDYLIVFASGKDRRPTDGSPLHTGFGLSSEGEELMLIDNNGLVRTLLIPSYPQQRSGFSFGYDSAEDRFRFMNLTPGWANETSEAFDSFFEEEVVFSVPRGFHDSPFEVSLSFADPLAQIRYTTDGITPGWATGTLYQGPLQVEETTLLRAIALVPGVGQSAVATHTYFLNLSDVESALPALSLVTDEDHLSGPDGIIASNNIEKRGRAWERPISVEYIELDNTEDVQINSGIRLHGQLGRGKPKKSYRLYFRDDYGAPALVYPLFSGIPVMEFNRLVLRSGVQDINPFILDEMARSIYGDMGHVTSHGIFTNMFLNGLYKGYYNPVERYDTYFFQSWYGGDEDWDVIRHSGLDEGSAEVWNSLMNKVDSLDLSVPENYGEVTALLDVVNFVDYLLLNISGGTDDWPHNNWTAARRQRDGAKFRFYVWDAEQIFGGGRIQVYRDTLADSLLAGTAPIPRLFQGLHQNSDFRALFASRFRKHFFENGALTDTHVMDRFIDYRLQMIGALPMPFATISLLWIPGRRHTVEKALFEAGLLEVVEVPVTNPPPRGELPEVEAQLTPGAPDLIADGFIDASDLMEFLDQKSESNQGETFGRRSFRDGSWERFDYPVELGTRSLVAIDFDHDGDIDLAASNVNHDTVSLFENTGNGTFLEPVKIPAKLAGMALGKGDFDGDGFTDLVVASDFMLQHEVTVLRSDAAAGFHAAGTTKFNDGGLTHHLHPRAAIPRDLDGDGDLDLIVHNESSVREMDPRLGLQPIANAFSTFLNDGSGSLAASGTIFGGSAILTSESALVAEDLDGDGDVDVVGLSGSTSLLLFFNVGNGDFSPPTEIQTANSPFPLIAVVGADFDGDGDIDLATCNDRWKKVHFLKNDGGAHFVLDEDLTATLEGPKILLPGDFNSDGRMDLLVSNFDTLLRTVAPLRVLYGTEEGPFAVSDGFFTADEVPFPESLAADDFDGDGDLDIALADEYNGSLTVFLNQLAPSPPLADIDGDNTIDLLDLLEIGKRWSNVTSP